MTADAAKKVCSNGTCEYESTGKCVEGTALEECSYLRVAQTEQEDTEEPSSVLDDISEEVDSGDHIIYDAEPLSVEQASSHMKERTTKIITMIGPAEAGKTSIIAEVYDAFQYQAYKQILFAGSKTLVGLEKICHKVRGTSRGGDLYQKRTDLKEHPVFYHLSIKVLHSDQRDLLISDRSGETYREILDQPEQARTCVELTRAHIVNLLVDGIRISEDMERASATSEAYQLVQSIIHCGIISMKPRLNVVLTKLDHVDKSKNKDKAREEFERLFRRVSDVAEGHFKEIRAFHVAARPHSSMYPKGYGVEDLVLDWLNPETMTLPYVVVRGGKNRSFDMIPSSLEQM